MSQQIDQDVMDNLVHCGSMSADTVAIGFVGTNAAKTRAIIERALEALIANGRIEVTSVDSWPEFYVLDPPYEDIFAKKE